MKSTIKPDETDLPPPVSLEADVSLESLQARLAEAERKAVENWDKFLRASAEVENVRRRAERDAGALQKYALERILSELITVLDSLELGLKAAGENADAKALTEGLQLIHKQFSNTLERYGISVIDPVGQPFNPDLHQAVSMVESAGAAPQCVLTVMQKGYRLHERLLRPAMVVVAKATTTGDRGRESGDVENTHKPH
ncbi:MAG: nucleotide exchange factor GrpE [Nevskiales bacterium]|nr:nucleotide exchange factor GrpE [Nevskiales bacterium]